MENVKKIEENRRKYYCTINVQSISMEHLSLQITFYSTYLYAALYRCVPIIQTTRYATNYHISLFQIISFNYAELDSFRTRHTFSQREYRWRMFEIKFLFKSGTFRPNIPKIQYCTNNKRYTCFWCPHETWFIDKSYYPIKNVQETDEAFSSMNIGTWITAVFH